MTLWSGNEGVGGRVRAREAVSKDGHSLESIREARKGIKVFEVK